MPLPQVQEENEDQQIIVKFQGVQLKGTHDDVYTGDINSFPDAVLQPIQQLVRVTKDALKSKFLNLLNDGKVGSSAAVYKLGYCFNPHIWPDSMNELVQFGNEDLEFLLEFFKSKLEELTMFYSTDKHPEQSVACFPNVTTCSVGRLKDSITNEVNNT